MQVEEEESNVDGATLEEMISVEEGNGIDILRNHDSIGYSFVKVHIRGW